ncbi:MAG: Na(+)-translocating NADH-quinone reductase subunit A [Calditrichia bacterium]
MGLIKLKKGLNVPISGEPRQVVEDAPVVSRVALLGDDYVGMKPTLAVQVGDTVKKGQVVFTDKKLPLVKYTAPASGKVVEINRGEKRRFLSLVIEVSGDDEVTFPSFAAKELPGLSRKKVVEELLESGMWPVIRQRPFNKVANPEGQPHSIFVNAMDTDPLAPEMPKVLEGREQDFVNGLEVFAKLTDGKVFLCKKPGDAIPTANISNLQVEEFDGPHPAGLVGTHIHFLDPVGPTKVVWHVDAQNVAAIGHLFTTGKLDDTRIVSLAGPGVKNPRLLKTRVGADLMELTKNELKDGEMRVVSGSVLSGHHAQGPLAFLGRFHQSVAALAEGRERKFLGWLSPGSNLFSAKPILLSALTPGKKFDFTTDMNGGHRAIVPIGVYEKVMPLDIMPTYLLRALAVNDIEESESLGCLELAEEDLALCTFVCPSKIDHGANLRKTLTLIEKEG